MNAIDELFVRLRSQQRKAFVAFLTAGDPDLNTTAALIPALAGAGADIVELGFPFSDPIADGQVIQASYTRALENGLRIEDVFACAEKVRRSSRPISAPLVAMCSYTLIHRRTPDKFLDRTAAAGFSGIVVPDLPAEEAEPFVSQARDRNLATILLVTPTTTAARAQKIVKLCSGFVYCVSVAGITGERDHLPEELTLQLRRLRQMTDLPLCVGFGVSKPEHAQLLREFADGIIVGSAIVRRVEQAAGNLEAAAAGIRSLVQPLLSALNPPTASFR